MSLKKILPSAKLNETVTKLILKHFTAADQFSRDASTCVKFGIAKIYASEEYRKQARTWQELPSNPNEESDIPLQAMADAKAAISALREMSAAWGKVLSPSDYQDSFHKNHADSPSLGGSRYWEAAKESSDWEAVKDCRNREESESVMVSAWHLVWEIAQGLFWGVETEATGGEKEAGTGTD